MIEEFLPPFLLLFAVLFLSGIIVATSSDQFPSGLFARILGTRLFSSSQQQTSDHLLADLLKETRQLKEEIEELRQRMDNLRA